LILYSFETHKAFAKIVIVDNVCQTNLYAIFGANPCPDSVLVKFVKMTFSDILGNPA